MATRALSESEIQSELATVSGWTLTDGQITREFTFDSYAHGLLFASAVGLRADQADHHPDLFVGYRRVRVSLNTHDVNGISPLDFALARQANALYEKS